MRLKMCRLVRVRALVFVFRLAGIQTSLIVRSFLVLGVFSADMRAGLHAAGRRATVTDRQTHAPFGAPMVRALGGAGGSTAHILGLVAGPHRLLTTPAYGLLGGAGARDTRPALGMEGRLGLRTFPRHPAGWGRPVTHVVQADRQVRVHRLLGLTRLGHHGTPRSPWRNLCHHAAVGNVPNNIESGS